PHPSDHHSAVRPVDDYLAAINDGIQGLRVGVVRGSMEAGTNASAERLSEFVAALVDLGAVAVEVSLPYENELSAATMVTVLSELAAYHAPDLRTRLDEYG